MVPDCISVSMDVVGSRYNFFLRCRYKINLLELTAGEFYKGVGTDSKIRTNFYPN